MKSSRLTLLALGFRKLSPHEFEMDSRSDFVMTGHERKPFARKEDGDTVVLQSEIDLLRILPFVAENHPSGRLLAGGRSWTRRDGRILAVAV